MDLITLDRINTAHPIIRDELHTLYLIANNQCLGKGVRLRFTHVYRSNAEQNDLYAIGRTKKGSKVTNAKGGQSIHNYGLAFDIVLLYDNNGDGKFEEASWDMLRDGDKDMLPDWHEVVKVFKDAGYEWGGDWKSFKDYPHFQKSFGNSWKTLMNKEKFVESINGKQYYYPKL